MIQNRGDKALRAFVLGLGRSLAQAKRYDPISRPLFPLYLILQAEGTLGEGAMPDRERIGFDPEEEEPWDAELQESDEADTPDAS